MDGRVSRSPHILAGKPYVTGTKLTVAFVLEMLKAGYTFEKILDSYPQIEQQDVQACLAYAIDLIEQGSGQPGPDAKEDA